jgi:hypothetical protein
MTATQKPEEMHLEHTRVDDIDLAKVNGYDSYGLVKSRFDELSLPRTLWVFKRVVLVSLAVYTGYVCEGFEVIIRHYNWLNEHGLIYHSLALEALSSQTQASSSNLAQRLAQA